MAILGSRDLLDLDVLEVLELLPNNLEVTVHPVFLSLIDLVNLVDQQL